MAAAILAPPCEKDSMSFAYSHIIHFEVLADAGQRSSAAALERAGSLSMPM